MQTVTNTLWEKHPPKFTATSQGCLPHPQTQEMLMQRIKEANWTHRHTRHMHFWLLDQKCQAGNGQEMLSLCISTLSIFTAEKSVCPQACMFFIYIQAWKIIINIVMVATGHCCKSTISPWERSVGKYFQAPLLLLSFLKLPFISGIHIVNLHLFWIWNAY